MESLKIRVGHKLLLRMSVRLEQKIGCSGLNTIRSFKSNRTNKELNFIEFLELFFTFRINLNANFQIESNKFWTNRISDNLSPTSSWSQKERIEFESVFIKFFEYFAFLNQTNRKSNEFRTNSNLSPPLTRTAFLKIVLFWTISLIPSLEYKEKSVFKEVLNRCLHHFVMRQVAKTFVRFSTLSTI